MGTEKRIAPGPRNLLGFAKVPGFFSKDRSKRVEQYAEHTRVYGDVVRYNIFGVLAHIIRHPDHIKHVFVENHAGYHKGRGLQKMKFFLGEGLLTSEGAFWLRQRRLTQPAFHRQKLEALTSMMTDCAEQVLSSWDGHARSGRVVDVAQEMMRMTLVIAARTLFSVDVGHEASAVRHALSVALEEGSRRTFTLFDFPMWVPTPRNVAYGRATAELDRVVYGIIDERRKKPSNRPDLLGMLLDAKDEDTGESMTDKQVRDETMTLFLAGHETTANSLAWTWLLLSRSPDVRRKLEAEVDLVLAGRTPGFADLPKLKYTRMVVDEAMRLYPPAWMVGRTALADDEIGGYHIPKGSIVAASTYLAHRHPSFWENPEGFDPERFSPEASAGRHKYAFMPFGAGPRVCIGNQFALMESQLVLAMMAQRYRLELVPGAKVELEPLVTLRPKGGIPMTVHARG